MGEKSFSKNSTRISYIYSYRQMVTFPHHFVLHCILGIITLEVGTIYGVLRMCQVTILECHVHCLLLHDSTAVICQNAHFTDEKTEVWKLITYRKVTQVADPGLRPRSFYHQSILASMLFKEKYKNFQYV